MADSEQRAGAETTSASIPPFDVLFLRYEKRIYNLILRMVGDVEDATDLTSQTFLHALRAYHRFRGEAQAYTWLYRIAINLCKNHFRKRDREARFQMISLDAPLQADGEEMERDIEDYSQAPERLIEGRATQELLQAAIMDLSTDLRTVIILRDVQGLSYQEIADITGCTVEAVKSRIFRARGHLRRVLGPHLRPQEGAEADTAAGNPNAERRNTT
jgi:RNA polymerase sigma-70 factor (ECF subfamily)